MEEDKYLWYKIYLISIFCIGWEIKSFSFLRYSNFYVLSFSLVSFHSFLTQRAEYFVFLFGASCLFFSFWWECRWGGPHIFLVSGFFVSFCLLFLSSWIEILNLDLSAGGGSWWVSEERLGDSSISFFFLFSCFFSVFYSICLLFLNQVQVGGAWVLGEWRDSGTRIGRFARQLPQHHRRRCCPSSLIIVIFHQNIFKSCPTTTVVTAVCQSPLIIVIFHQTPVWGKNTLKNCSTTTATVVTDVRQSPHSLSHWKWFIIVIDL